MRIEKLIKVYFVFVVAVIGMATSTQMSWGQSYLASIFSSNDAANEEIGEVVPLPVLENSEANFHILNDAGNTFVLAGTKDKEIMQYVLKAKEKDLELKNLRLKINGIHQLGIEKAYIVAEGKIIAEGKKHQGYLVFGNMNFKVKNGEEKILSFRVDVSPYAEPGTRIRLDIEEAGDLIMTSGNKEVSVSEEYPVFGKYLSVARKR